MVNKNDITIDEAVSLLKKTSLPTIIVEGSDDIIVYRRFEDELQHYGVSILPVGGREKVLELFLRRAEYSANVSVAYIADRDTWINTSVPIDYQHHNLVLTNGYSIENDVIVDGELWTLLRSDESQRFQVELSLFCEWYALALHRHLRDPKHTIALHPDHVLNPSQRQSLLTLGDNETYPVMLRDSLLADANRLIRGKSLMALLIRHLSYKGRDPRHSSGSLLEWVASRPGPSLNRLKENIESVFRAANSID